MKLETVARCAPLLLALLLGQTQTAFAQQHRHTLPLVMSASSISQQGFVRIINRSERAGAVRIDAIDDAGNRFGPISLSLDAKETVNFSSNHLEQGDTSRGLSGGLGSGEGHWRLILTTDLDVLALAYIRTPDGFVTSMHEVVKDAAMRHHVVFFNPGSNAAQRSLLRIVNPGDAAAEVVVEGLDDRGIDAPGGDVRLTLQPRAARMLSAQMLETGGAGIDGRLGDGAGKWQLFVSAGNPIVVMSLLASPTGNLTNLSTTAAAPTTTEPPPPPPLEGCAEDAAFNALVLGKRVLIPGSELRFFAGNRFRQTFTAYGVIFTGSYTYRKTGVSTAQMHLRGDDGQRCDVALTCSTPTEGTLRSSCRGSASEEWRIIP